MTKRWMSLGLVGAAAVVAVGAGAVAVNAAAPATDRTVLSEDDVARQLAAQPQTAPATAPASVSASAVTRTFTTGAGTIVVACQGGHATLLRWTPKTGFRGDDLTADGATVTFEFKSATVEETFAATCVAGIPTVTVHHDDNHGGDNSPQPEPGDDHGGNRGGDGSAGPGGGTGGSGSGGSGGGGTDDPAGHH